MSDIPNVNDRPKWLIVQMGHLGKLMQTVPAINGAKLLNPAPHIHIVVDDEYAELAEMIDGVEKVIPVNRNHWRKLLNNSMLSWTERFDQIGNLPADLENEEYDFAVNLTHNPESAYIVPLTGIKDQSGLLGDRLGLKMLGKWELYYHTAQSMQGLGAFNLSDIHICQAKSAFPAAGGGINVDTDSLNQIYDMLRPEKQSRPLIAIQIGACPPSRQWGLQNYKNLAELLVKQTNARIVMVGSQDEAELSRSLSRLYKDNIISLAGEATPQQLALILKCCDLMIGGDTGILQLAAAIGIQTVSIFKGEADVDLRTPYGKRHVVFASDPLLNAGISSEAVFNVVDNILHGQQLHVFNGNGYRMMVTDFDEHGFLVLKGSGADITDKRRNMLRQLWGSEFLGFQPKSNNDLSGILNQEEKEELQKLTNTAKAGSYIARDIYSALYNRRSPDHLVRALTEVKIIIDDISSRSGIPAMLALLHKLEQEMLRKRNSGFITELEETYASLYRHAQFVLDADTREFIPVNTADNLRNMVREIVS